MTVSRTILLTVLAGCLLAAAGGCSAPVKLRNNDAETYGKVYYLDGVGCYGFGKHTVPQGFRDAGYRGDVEYWSWSATGTPFDQVGGPFIRSKGKDLAELIVLYKETYPQRPVSLIGLSGGTGVVVFACEQLPEGVSVDEVVLIASSVSSRHDLTPALRHIRGNITLFETSGDLALGVGARMLGNIDGEFGTPAGLVGFSLPDRQLSDEERSLYQRVINVPYAPSFAALGFTGNHTSAVDSPLFIKTKIAPLILPYRASPGTEGRPPGPIDVDLGADGAPQAGTQANANGDFNSPRSRADREAAVHTTPAAEAPGPPAGDLIWWPQTETHR
ncbi:MAG: hypothetical protein BIFFINMI_00524 [Phycisphaerae bacterium]|nr:hypothetical protein [Phycisphaerae bacterium]